MMIFESSTYSGQDQGEMLLTLGVAEEDGSGRTSSTHRRSNHSFSQVNWQNDPFFPWALLSAPVSQTPRPIAPRASDEVGKDSDAVSPSTSHTSFTSPSKTGSMETYAGTKRSRPKKKATPMDALCFTDTIEHLTSKNVADLTRAYVLHGGKLPSRKELRCLSNGMSLSQSRIRRWFLDNANLSSTPRPDPLPFTSHTDIGTSPEKKEGLDKRLDELESKCGLYEHRLELIDSQIAMMKDKVSELEGYSYLGFNFDC